MAAAAPVTAKQDTTGWIAEWTRDPTPCRDACADALPIFSLDVVGIVVKLLRKHDLFGKAELEAAYGKTRLEEQVGGVVHELPLPDNIDVILQTDLSALFSEKARACWAGKQKVTDVFSLYFKPENLLPTKALDLAGIACDSTDPWLKVVDKKACWVLFPDECTGLDRSFHSQTGDSYIPKGFAAAPIGEAIFCISTKYACLKERLYVNQSLRCFLQNRAYHLISFTERGLTVVDRTEDVARRNESEASRKARQSEREGVAPMMKFEGPIKI